MKNLSKPKFIFFIILIEQAHIKYFLLITKVRCYNELKFNEHHHTILFN